jgi:hypothetical protein
MEEVEEGEEVTKTKRRREEREEGEGEGEEGEEKRMREGQEKVVKINIKTYRRQQLDELCELVDRSESIDGATSKPIFPFIQMLYNYFYQETPPTTLPPPTRFIGREFKAIIFLHGGYTPEKQGETIIPAVTYYTCDRQIIHLSPLGSQSWGTRAHDSLILNLIFLHGVDPVVAGQYVFTTRHLSETNSADQLRRHEEAVLTGARFISELEEKTKMIEGVIEKAKTAKPIIQQQLSETQGRKSSSMRNSLKHLKTLYAKNEETIKTATEAHTKVSEKMDDVRGQWKSAKHLVKEGKMDRPINERLDETYQCPLIRRGTPSLIKGYQQDFPVVDSDSPIYSYKLFDSNDIYSNNEYFGCIFAGFPNNLKRETNSNKGYFILEDFSIQCLPDFFGDLKGVLAIVEKYVPVDAFSISPRVSDTFHTIHYKRGFDMSQCKYFIAYMLLLYIREKHKGKNLEQAIKDTLRQHVEGDEGSYTINERLPFLVRTLDHTIPKVLSKFTEPFYYEPGSPSIKKWLPEGSSNMMRLRGLRADITHSRASSSKPPPLTRKATATTTPEITLKDEFIYATICPQKEELYKLAIFEFTEKHLMDFLGITSENTVTEYQYNCASVMFPLDTTETQQNEFYKSIDACSMGRGSRRTSSRRTLKKYKSKRKRKTKKK